MSKKILIMLVAAIVMFCLSACNEDVQKIEAENKFHWNIESMETPTMKNIEIVDEVTNHFSDIDSITNNILNNVTIQNNFKVTEIKETEYLHLQQDQKRVVPSVFRREITLSSEDITAKIELVSNGMTSKSINSFVVGVYTNCKPGDVQDFVLSLVSSIDKDMAPYLVNAKDNDIGNDHPAHLIEVVRVENGRYELRREVYDRHLFISCDSGYIETQNLNQTTFLHDEVSDVVFLSLSDVFKNANTTNIKDPLKTQDLCASLANEIVRDGTTACIKLLATRKIVTDDAQWYESSIEIVFENNGWKAGSIRQHFYFITDSKGELTLDSIVDCDMSVHIYFSQDGYMPTYMKDDMKSTMLKTIDLILPSANFSQLDVLSKLESLELDESGDYTGKIQYEVLGRVKTGTFRLSSSFDVFDLRCETVGEP